MEHQNESVIHLPPLSPEQTDLSLQLLALLEENLLLGRLQGAGLPGPLPPAAQAFAEQTTGAMNDMLEKLRALPVPAPLLAQVAEVCGGLIQTGQAQNRQHFADGFLTALRLLDRQDPTLLTKTLPAVIASLSE